MTAERRGAKRESGEATEPLRGQRHVPPVGMGNYLVLLQADPRQSRQRQLSRSEITVQGLSRTEAFRSKLRQWLADSDRDGEVAWLGEPTTLGFLVSLAQLELPRW